MGMEHAGSLRDQAKQLMDRRCHVEGQIEAIATRLNAPGGGGTNASLVDKEGFPRADIDIPRVRSDRHRLATLHADHKQLTGQIEALLLQIHSQAKPREQREQKEEREEQRPAAITASVPAAAGDDTAAVAGSNAAAAAAGSGSGVPDSGTPGGAASLTPFAMIDEVTPGSPAEADGIRLGDRLLSFGPVAAAAVAAALGEDGVTGSGGAREAGGAELLRQVAGELHRSEGKGVRMTVLRAGNVVELVVTPRRWNGRGLLGCHLSPISHGN